MVLQRVMAGRVSSHRDSSRPAWHHVLFWLAIAAAPMVLNSPYTARILTTGLIAAIFVLGINLKVGWAGLFSVGDAAFYGVGAYTTAILTTQAGLSPWIGMLAAVAVSALSGYVVGVPLIRLHTHYLALATLGVNLIAVSVFNNWIGLTRGAGGIVGVPPLSIGPWTLTTYNAYSYLVMCVLAAVMVVCAKLNHSRFGRAWRSLRDAESAANLMGVNVQAAKRHAFAISGAIFGIAGALFAHSVQYVSPDQYGVHLSILGLTMAVVGGIGGLYGPVIAAIGLTALPEVLRFADTWYMLIYGAGLYLLVVFLPDQIGGRQGGSPSRKSDPADAQIGRKDALEETGIK